MALRFSLNPLGTLKSRLTFAGLLLALLISAATALGYTTVSELTREISQRFEGLRQSTSIGSELEGLILEQVAAGERYLETRDPALQRTFEDRGWKAHALRQGYKDLPEVTQDELTKIARLEELHSRIEVEYALAHALLETGRAGEARARAEGARPVAQELQAAIREISAAQTLKLATARQDLERLGEQRQTWLLAVLALSLLLGAAVIVWTIAGISRPMSVLIGAAHKIGEGDLRIHIEGKMASEYQTLATAFNRMADQLRTIVSETVTIAEQISASASDLSSITEEVAASSGEVATAMVEITRGAEGQSSGLQTSVEALEEMNRRAGEIAGASGNVTDLSQEIHQVAAASRQEVSTAIQMLLEVREVVRTSSNEVTELEAASSQIDRFVETISAIARQTNLLALNAAIEAARAGEHGRGFAVVADEVRKLAEGSARAAQEVAQSVVEIRSRIERVVATMETGTQKVANVEEVSKGADVSLEQIITAVDGVRAAAVQVADAVKRNQEAMVDVEQAVSDVAGTAESHAASAQEVSAAAEEQSAATQEMSAASAQLLHSADRMKQLVSGLQV
jgi:methyl-accepting chemotaxis protein